MEDCLPHIVLENPPWVGVSLIPRMSVFEIPASNSLPAHPDLNAYTVVNFDGWFTDTLRAKLVSVDTTQSIELNRQVLLALHDSGHSPVQWVEVADLDESFGPQVYDAYGVALPRKPIEVDLLTFGELHGPYGHLWNTVPSAYAFEFAQLLFLHVLSFVIDRIVDYWNAIAKARSAWLFTSVIFRALRTRRLAFKPRHTPLRLIPSSIHPIEQAA